MAGDNILFVVVPRVKEDVLYDMTEENMIKRANTKQRYIEKRIGETKRQ